MRLIADGDGGYIVVPPRSPGNIIKATEVVFVDAEPHPGWQEIKKKAYHKNGEPAEYIEVEPFRFRFLTDKYVIFEFLAINFDTKQVVAEDIEINKDAKPDPPKPDPDVEPDPVDPDVPPQPGPAPIEGDGLRVLFVHESAEPMPREFQPAFYGPKVADYLNANCVKVDGHPEFRRLDPDTQFTDPNHRFAKALKRPRTADPWLIISNGTSGYEGPFPATEQETLDLIQRYTPVNAQPKQARAPPAITMIKSKGECRYCDIFIAVEAGNLVGLLEVVEELDGVKPKIFPTFVVRGGNKTMVLEGYQKADVLKAKIKHLEAMR